MPNSLVAKILALYGLEFRRILPPQKGYRNQSFPIELSSGVMANLILYKSEPGILTKITDANHVSNFLAKAGMPARATLSDQIIQLRNQERIKYGSLYTYLPGKTIPWEAYTRRHIKLLGKTMSDMHFRLEQAPTVHTNVIHEYQTIIKRMQKYFSDPQVQNAMEQKLNLQLPFRTLDRAEKILIFCQSLPHSQVLHMDFVRGNLLFTGKSEGLEISGVLDFEKTAYGPKLFDISRTLALLLVDCKNTPEEKIYKYFLDSGYEKYGLSSLKVANSESSEKDRQREFQTLEELTNLFLAYDFYKFLRHNPYESLEANEHFIRTRDLLQKRQRLTNGKA